MALDTSPWPTVAEINRVLEEGQAWACSSAINCKHSSAVLQMKSLVEVGREGEMLFVSRLILSS